MSNIVFNRSSVNADSVTLVRLPGTHYLTALSSSRTLVDLNSFSSLIYFTLVFDILLAPWTICKPRSTSPNLYLFCILCHHAHSLFASSLMLRCCCGQVIIRPVKSAIPTVAKWESALLHQCYCLFIADPIRQITGCGSEYLFWSCRDQLLQSLSNICNNTLT